MLLGASKYRLVTREPDPSTGEVDVAPGSVYIQMSWTEQGRVRLTFLEPVRLAPLLTEAKRPPVKRSHTEDTPRE